MGGDGELDSVSMAGLSQRVAGGRVGVVEHGRRLGPPTTRTSPPPRNKLLLTTRPERGAGQFSLAFTSPPTLREQGALYPCSLLHRGPPSLGPRNSEGLYHSTSRLCSGSPILPESNPRRWDSSPGRRAAICSLTSTDGWAGGVGVPAVTGQALAGARAPSRRSALEEGPLLQETCARRHQTTPQRCSARLCAVNAIPLLERTTQIPPRICPLRTRHRRPLRWRPWLPRAVRPSRQRQRTFAAGRRQLSRLGWCGGVTLR